MIIGVIGPMKSGKNYMADKICELFPQFEPVAYGTAIKRISAILIDGHTKNIRLHDNQDYKSKVITTPMGTTETVRSLQRKVSDVFRSMHIGVWENILYKNYDAASDNWVINDSRSKGQCQGIIDRGGHIIVIEKPDMTINKNDHWTEYEWYEWLKTAELDHKDKIHYITNMYGTDNYDGAKYVYDLCKTVSKILNQ